MPHLIQKNVNGKTYYYVEQRKWENGKSVRKWQKYLGSLDKIMQSVDTQQDIAIDHSFVYEFGGVAAYLSFAHQLGIEDRINRILPKKQEGISIGKYLLIAAINRGLHATSKNSMQQWYKDTFLFTQWPEISQKALSAQRFWDNMDSIPTDKIQEIWQDIISHTIKAMGIDLSKICYDGTNYYTFISSFNVRSTLARRGKNKQGRRDLRQINYALFCSQKDHIPLYFDVYEGNRHDGPEFHKIIQQFGQRFQDKACGRKITIIFDKGNNGAKNIEALHTYKFHYIGSLKLMQVKELKDISNSDSCLKPSKNSSFEAGAKFFRTQKVIYGHTMTVILVYSPNLHQTQTQTLITDIEKSCKKLSELRQQLMDRANGLVTKGRKPSASSVKRQVNEILKRQYMKEVIEVEHKTLHNTPVFDYSLNEDTLKKIKDTDLGKKVLFTNNHHWESEDIILAYNNQAVIENIFRESKNREYGNWWPLYHYTDHKVMVHGLYCTITLLLRSLIAFEMRKHSTKISMERLHDELSGIKQVVNVVNKNSQKRQTKKNRVMSLTKMNEVQAKLFKILNLQKYVKI